MVGLLGGYSMGVVHVGQVAFEGGCMRAWFLELRVCTQLALCVCVCETNMHAMKQVKL